MPGSADGDVAAMKAAGGEHQGRWNRRIAALCSPSLSPGMPSYHRAQRKGAVSFPCGVVGYWNSRQGGWASFPPEPFTGFAGGDAISLAI
jgi:hypothetical protein